MIKSFKGKKPVIPETAFIAETAVVIGDVELGENVSVWYGTTIRGDLNNIKIGRETNIQENSVIHVDSPKPGSDYGRTVIGERVTVGHGAIVHGCEIGDDCLIGMGAVIMNGAKVGSGSIVAAGSLVPERLEIPPRSLVMGIPAEVKGIVSDEKNKRIRDSAQHYLDLKAVYSGN